ncbi:MAG: hypothetical protein JNL90_00790 [Planctomycetes bacterium]|nr:hypothetical protein [Planctomycetota bacterium]
MSSCLALLLACNSAAPAQAAAHPPLSHDELLPPVRLEANGQPIDAVEIGHAAPFFGDFDDDGVPDLLVGQFLGGRLLVYKNLGTATAPKLAAGVTFQDGRVEGTVPTG